jgi:hypothetical protein
MTTETVPDVLTDEQVGDLYLDWYCFFKDNPGSAGLCIRAIEQAVLQSPEIQALRKDAERYRFCRSQTSPAEIHIHGIELGLAGLELDEAMDHEMKEWKS